MEHDNQDYIAQVHAAKKRKTIIGIAAAVACLLLILFIFVDNSEKGAVLDEVTALNLAPALELSDEELSLAETILDYDDFRNALNYDIVENSSSFTPEETEAIIGAVIPGDAVVTEVTVAGAVVTIGYEQPQHQVFLEYVDADRSGKVDTIRKTLAPKIDGVTTGCYQVVRNLSTGKIVYTYTSF